jgi:DNA primase
MPAFTQEFLERINKHGIETTARRHVPLTRKGGELWGCCPFHREKSPSFHIIPNRGKFKCFGCGKSGDAIDLVTLLENTGFQEAVEIVAHDAGIPIELENTSNPGYKPSNKQLLLKAHEEIQTWFKTQINKPENKAVLDYLTDERKLPPKTIQDANLGFAPENQGTKPWTLIQKKFGTEIADASGLFYKPQNPSFHRTLRWQGRLMIPLHDTQGRICAFTGRLIPGFTDPISPGAKYLNSPNTTIFTKGNFLFNQHKAWKHPPDKNLRLMLTEGPLDTLRLDACGFPHAVASQGTNVTAAQIQILASHPNGVLCLFDGDDAGKKAVEKIIPPALSANLDIRFAFPKSGEDPDSILKNKTPASTRKIIETWHENALSPMRAAASSLLPPNPSPNQKQEFNNKICRWLLATNNHTLAHDCLKEIASLLETDFNALWADYAARLTRPPTDPNLENTILKTLELLQKTQNILTSGLSPKINPDELHLVRITDNKASIPPQTKIKIIIGIKKAKDALENKDILSQTEIQRLQNLITQGELCLTHPNNLPEKKQQTS